MTKRYPLRSALCSGNSGDPRDFQRVSLGSFALANLFESGAANANKSVRRCFPHSRGFGADVDHSYFRAFAEMGKTLHSTPRRGRTMAISPTSQLSFSGDTITNALDSAIVTTSPEPCHGRREASAAPRTVGTGAERKWVNSLFSRSP